MSLGTAPEVQETVSNYNLHALAGKIKQLLALYLEKNKYFIYCDQHIPLTEGLASPRENCSGMPPAACVDGTEQGQKTSCQVVIKGFRWSGGGNAG